MPSTFTALITEPMPTINKILNILDPTTFPIAMLSSPFLIAVTDVTSSGSDVPTATIVRPISVSLTPNALAILLAPFTTACPPQITAAIPITSIIISRPARPTLVFPT